ncbi:hypothetical protein C8J57DRAFT_1536849 [Mycena rebaudengoi]|nr:hypothetical protein C8J57DRAFT_1536849 [Mycena rebaudengoi]
MDEGAPICQMSLEVHHVGNVGRDESGCCGCVIVFAGPDTAHVAAPHRTALFYGGVVGRLARLVLAEFEDIACLDPSENILKAGSCMSSENGEALWHEDLMEDEIDIICRVYVVETGQKSKMAESGHQLEYISWWLKPTAFWSSGLNTGWWNANCERWFVKRLRDMETKPVKLYTYAEWKTNLRFSSAARKVNMKNNEIAAQYLAGRFP